MNQSSKMREAMSLFKTKLSPEQYEQFCLLAEELDLTIEDVSSWEEIAKELETSFIPNYIKQ